MPSKMATVLEENGTKIRFGLDDPYMENAIPWMYIEKGTVSFSLHFVLKGDNPVEAAIESLKESGNYTIKYPDGGSCVIKFVNTYVVIEHSAHNTSQDVVPGFSFIIRDCRDLVFKGLNGLNELVKGSI